jgi:hypothetical protein
MAAFSGTNQLRRKYVGTAADFGRWKAHHLAGWDFDQVLKTYKALENAPPADLIDREMTLVRA